MARAATAAMAIAIVFVLTVVMTQSAQAQQYTVIHNFTGGGDGGSPWAGLTIDAAGNLYGTTLSGGRADSGTVFKLKRSGSNWVLTPLYSFAGGNDGALPYGRVAVAHDGTLYGTTTEGGNQGNCGSVGCGTLFHLTPSPTAPRSALAPWNKKAIYLFTGSDGASPQGDLIFDQSGNIYGTTQFGGDNGNGVIYELTPSGNGWSETILYSTQNGNDVGSLPSGGVVFDRSGNLYGVFENDGPEFNGAVYELSPSGSSWTEQILYAFVGPSDGANPIGGLIIDPSGNLYGTTGGLGTGGGGTVFELTSSNGGWTLNTLSSFSSNLGYGVPGSWAKLVMDAAGNLYGTTYLDGAYGYGAVFKLTRSNGGWTYTSLHDFCAGGLPCSDGSNPISNVVFDADGNLYGTASSGGSGMACVGECGVVWKITP